MTKFVLFGEDMRNINTRTRTIKKRIDRSKNILFAYSELQLRYAERLELNNEIVDIKANVRLIDFELGDNYTSDFYYVKSNGEVVVRECVYKDKLLKPRTIRLLDASRSYWLNRGVSNWGIVLNED